MVEFLKIREVKDPQRDKGNAGIDVFVPELTVGYIKDFTLKNPDIYVNIEEGYFSIGPGQSALIPLGLKTKFEENIALEAANKSGVATKKKLFVGASVVDSSYQGEIHGHVVNVGNDVQKVKFGEKIVQFIPRLIDTTEHKVHSGITEEEFFNGITTARGQGGFGSTGTM